MITLRRNLRTQLAGLATLPLAFTLLGPNASAQAPATPPATSSSPTQADDPAAAYAATIVIPDPRKPIPSRPGAYTLAQIIDLARTKNPTLIAAERNLRAVRAQEIQAAVRQNPDFALNGSTLTYDANAQNPYTYAAQVSRLFERGDKRKYRLDDARATTAQTQAQLEDTVRQTILTLKTAFTQMLEAKASLQLTSASLAEFQHEVDIANDRFQAGDLSKIDFERLDLQLASFESDESTDLVNLRQSSDQLQTLMGVETPTTDFDILGDIVPPTLSPDRAALIQTALDKRPDYAAARFAVTAAIANQHLAYANGTADPTVGVEYDRAGHENSVGFQFSIPLRIFDRNQGNKQTAVFQTDASRFSEAAARFQVISDVDQAWIGYTQSKRLADRYNTHFLDESRDVLTIAQFAFEHGGIALIDYLDAVRDTRTVNSAALTAYQQAWVAIHQLAAASATELVP